MILVTGAFGMIGSSLVKSLVNSDGVTVIGVDDLTDGRKFIILIEII